MNGTTTEKTRSSTGKIEEITAVIERIVFRKPTLPGEEPDPFVIARTTDGHSVKGAAPSSNFDEGMTYRFFGQWENSHPKYGRTFKFTSYAQAEPISRLGLIKYLAKNCPGVGSAIASLMFEYFGPQAAQVLRQDPDRVHQQIPRLSLEHARAASRILQANARFEDTRIALLNLIDGCGFPSTIYDQLLNDRRYGAAAPSRINRDPFCLLVDGFPGAGFNRCDQLYLRLGLPPARTKRQMFCLWHHMETDRNGHTWFRVDELARPLRERIGGVAPNLEKAIRLGVRAGWLAIRQENGLSWVARAEDAEAEESLADNVGRIIHGRKFLPLFTEAIEGECDGTTLEHEEAVLAELSEAPGDTTAVHQLARIGQRLGICQFCGRSLASQESKSRGYGPVCAERHGLPWGQIVTEEQSVATSVPVLEECSPFTFQEPDGKPVTPGTVYEDLI